MKQKKFLIYIIPIMFLALFIAPKNVFADLDCSIVVDRYANGDERAYYKIIYKDDGTIETGEGKIYTKGGNVENSVKFTYHTLEYPHLTAENFADGKCPQFTHYADSDASDDPSLSAGEGGCEIVGGVKVCDKYYRIVLSQDASDSELRGEGAPSGGSEYTEDSQDSQDKNEELKDIELGEAYTCEDLTSTKTYGYIKDLFFLVQIIVPILLLVLGSLDFIRAIASQNDDGMKKAQSSFVKRLIIAVIIFLMPSVLNLLFSFLTNAFDITTCGIGTEVTTDSNQ